MKRVVILAVLFTLLFTITASAKTVDELYEEQLRASGAQELLENLPPETRELLSILGIDSLDPRSVTETDLNTVLQTIWQWIVNSSTLPIRSCVLVFGVILLHAWMGGVGGTLGGKNGEMLFSVVSTLVTCTVVVTPLAACIQEVKDACESLSVYMMSFVPVYVGVLLTGGHTVSAFSFRSIVLYAAQLLSLLSNNWLVPLMGVTLAIGVIGSVTPDLRLSQIGEKIGKTTTWVLSLVCGLFTGLLSLQNLVGSAANTLGNRAMQFSLSSFVPVVGSSLSEAFTTIRSCVTALRSTVGGIGIGAAVCIVLPPLLSCVLWNLCLSLCLMGSETFQLTSVTSVLKSAQAVLRCLIGVLAAGAMFSIVAVTVVSLSLKG